MVQQVLNICNQSVIFSDAGPLVEGLGVVFAYRLKPYKGRNCFEFKGFEPVAEMNKWLVSQV